MTVDMIIDAGRTPYRIDFDDAGYDQEDAVGRFVDFTAPNAWSSRSLLNPELHLPCLDVDGDRAAATLSLDAAFREYAPGSDFEWVESTTAGHWHAYLDWPIAWPVYLELLEELEGIVLEAGYVKAARKRRATFVRMPGVLKEPKRPAPPLPIPPTIAALYGDEEPF